MNIFGRVSIILIVMIGFSDLMAYKQELIIVIPSYNNKEWCKKNLDSLLMQEYQGWRVILIDDCSNDGTGQIMENYVQEKKLKHKIKIIHNAERKGALYNLYHAIHSCPDNAIIATIDGDDWLANSRTLNDLMAQYEDQNVWMTYGTYQIYPSNELGAQVKISEYAIKANAHRNDYWCASHLRTFYAKLFKLVKLEDLLYDGEFFQVTWDMAFMFPMLEMAGSHSKHIAKVMYIYNQSNPNNDHKVNLARQLHCEKVLRSRKKYNPLKALFEESTKDSEAAVIIFAHHPVKLLATLETLDRYVNNKAEIYVVYQADMYDEIYHELKNQFNFIWIPFRKNEFKDAVLQSFNRASTSHILCINDSCIIKDFINTQELIAHLEKTHAHMFDLMLGKNIIENKKFTRKQRQPKLSQVGEDIYAWQFIHGENDWRSMHSLQACMYKKSDLIMHMQELNFDTLSELMDCLGLVKFDHNRVGLCFEQSKALIMHQQEKRDEQLMASFIQGLKIDVVAPFRKHNDAIINDDEIQLISR